MNRSSTYFRILAIKLGEKHYLNFFKVQSLKSLQLISECELETRKFGDLAQESKFRLL